MSRNILACCGLLATLLTSSVASAATPSTLEGCLELAAQVADSCPNACTNRHCAERCIPPFAETGRCGRCQEHCLQICESMDQSRTADCNAAEHEAKANTAHE